VPIVDLLCRSSGDRAPSPPPSLLLNRHASIHTLAPIYKVSLEMGKGLLIP